MPETPLFPSLSVIIPTYNRKELVAKALEGYLAQSSPQLIHELLVVDDGSTDDTESVVQGFTRRSPFPIRYLRQSNKGPAAARNFGIREATSSIVLFTDSDIVPERELVAQHLEWHRNNPQMGAAVLGYVTWPPEIKATPFMRWYGEDRLFIFNRLRNQRRASFQCFYTCNLSLKTEFLRTCGQFDERFKSAAYEDIELGYRLTARGLQLLYNSEAIGFHHQFFSFENACQKAWANTAAQQFFFQTEAGQAVLKEIQQRRSGFGYLIARKMATGVAKVLAPARRLLDSSVPLPWIVYQFFLWLDTPRLVISNAVETGKLGR